MKSYVTLNIIAHITVPKKLWPDVRRALQRHLNERERDHGDLLIASSDQVDFFAFPQLLHRQLSTFAQPTRHQRLNRWWRQAVVDLPIAFAGELHFHCAP